MELMELTQFIRFLQDELDIFAVNLQLALRHPEQLLTCCPSSLGNQPLAV